MSAHTTASVSVICVNFRTEQQVAGLIAQLLQEPLEGGPRVFIVDNSSPPGSTAPLFMKWLNDRRLHLLTPGENLGYFGGAQFALDHIARIGRLSDWIILSNPDIRLDQPDFLDRLVNLYPQDPPSVVAPAILSTLSGADQNPWMRARPATARMHFYKLMYRHSTTLTAYYTASAIKRRARAIVRKIGLASGRDRPAPVPEPIYAPAGAFMIFNRGYFDAGGSFRHGAFLFGEEITVGETARRLGLSVVYDPRLKVRHRQFTTTSLYGNPLIAEYLKTSSAYLADTFFPIRPIPRLNK
jgi:GT2 family glycosyltransferase